MTSILFEKKTIIMKKKILLILFFYISLHKLHAQVLPQTPNAAELGRYGQIPTDLFNGLPQIAVPIHTIKVKDIEVPIQLSYYASGLKVQQHPTWVGLGWNLSCGGSITRVIHGFKDERNNTDVIREGGPGFNGNPVYGYFYRGYLLNRIDWLSEASFTNFFPAGEGTQSNYADSEPDEFIVNAPGINASFYMYRDTDGLIKIKVKSKDGRRIKVEVENKDLVVDFYAPTGQTNNGTRESLPKPFYKFTITTEDGKIYTFGGDVDAIEFSSSITLGYRNTIAVTWYLASIKGATDGLVNFTYKRDGSPLLSNNVISELCAYGKNQKPEDRRCSYSGLSTTAQYPIYLFNVSGSDGTQIDFKKSQTLELKDDTDTLVFYKATNIAPKIFMPLNHWMRLDGIVINNSKSIKFNYTSDNSKRLKLDSLTISDVQNKNAGTYRFGYNKTSLPGYNSKMSDNWGYYNGKKYEGIASDKLYEYRSANESLMQAEMLISIGYPTGGATLFEYEGHNYSKIASQLPDFKLTLANGTAGGLRIKKIISRPDAKLESDAVIKEYDYLNEDNSSSGILSGIPVYIATGHSRVKFNSGGWDGLAHYSSQADYEQNYIFKSESFMNLLGNTNGNHITYSRVIEKTNGNGKVIYRYTNHDEFPDQAPSFVLTNVDQRTLTDEFTSRELERGLLTSQVTYNKNDKPVESITNEYNSDPDRYNDFVKSISKTSIPGIGTMPFIRMDAYLIYTFYPYLQKKTVTNHTAAPVSRTVQYTYDSNDNNLNSVVSVDSKGRTSTVTYSYPGNMRDSSTIYKSMYDDKHMISQVIKESKVIIKSKESIPIPTYFKRTNYAEVGTGIYMPASIDQRIGSYPIEKLINYTYDNKGNISSKSIGKGPVTSYMWGYAGQFPIATIENANAASSEAAMTTKYFNYIIPEGLGKGSGGFTTNVLADMKLDINAQPGFTYKLQYTLSGAGVYKNGYLCISRTSKQCTDPSTVVFKDMPAGSYILSIETVGPDPNGTYRSVTLQYQDKQIAAKGTNEFFYEGFEESNNDNVVTSILAHTGRSYWSGSYTPVFSQPGGRSYIIQWWNLVDGKWNFNQKAYAPNLNLTGAVDDVRIFPIDAKMTTYTYDPQVGMTSHIDEKGQSFSYEYDGVQRLITVKDQNGNIVKSNSYNFKN